MNKGLKLCCSEKKDYVHLPLLFISTYFLTIKNKTKMKRTKNAVMACLLFAFALFAVQSCFSNPPPEKDKIMKVYEKKNSISQVPVIIPANEMETTLTFAVYEPVIEVTESPQTNGITYNNIRPLLPKIKYDNTLIKIARPPAWNSNILLPYIY